MKIDPMNGHFRRLPFWDRVALQTEIVGDCHLYTGHKNEDGYGRVGRDGRLVFVHREVWERDHGPIQDGLEVMHKCDNPSCIRPEHLSIGTHKDNMADCSRKGRKVQGGEWPTAKLNEHKVTVIKRRLLEGATNAALGREYGVSATLISHIRNGLKWRHVG